MKQNTREGRLSVGGGGEFMAELHAVNIYKYKLKFAPAKKQEVKCRLQPSVNWGGHSTAASFL
jgi:hypothetical protein